MAVSSVRKRDGPAPISGESERMMILITRIIIIDGSRLKMGRETMWITECGRY